MVCKSSNLGINLQYKFNSGHPFYNIKRIKDDKYVLEMALAGYKKSEVKVDVTVAIILFFYYLFYNYFIYYSSI